MKKPLYLHLIFIVIGIVLSVIYLSPVLEGKLLVQSDSIQSKAMQAEVLQAKESKGYYSLWTNTSFSGMPTFTMGVDYKNPVIGSLLTPFEQFFKSPLCYLIYYFVGFYILMIALRVDPWLAFLGAIMFTFSSYNFIILEAGHNTKARNIGLMPLVLAGVIFLFQKRYWVGAILVSLFMFHEIKSNHPQITYYLLIILGCYFVYQLVETIRSKEWLHFSKAVGIFTLATMLAVMANFAQLWVVYEYTKDTMRGGSELAVTGIDNGKNKKGLDKDYAFQWSYGKMESFTFLIPNAFGGSSSAEFNEDSKIYEFLSDKNIPAEASEQISRQLGGYWGPKPFTSGPVYLGVLVCFLFVLGIVVLKDAWRWWLVAASLIGLLLAWGKNLMWFNSLAFDIVPFYNKFRTVEMALVILQMTFPLMAVLTLQRILDAKMDRAALLKKFYYVAGGFAAVILIFAVMPSSVLDFKGLQDEQIKEMYAKQGGAELARDLMSAVKAERARLVSADAWTAFLILILGAGLLFAYLRNKISAQIVLVAFTLITLVDLWRVDKRYLNDDKFTEATSIEDNYAPSEIDRQIMADNSVSYRVFNVATDPFNDAIPSYFHKNVGGYNPAKLARYQDLIDSCIRKNNQNVLNMLNTKYIIFAPQQNAKPMVQMNPQALGNAWFIDTLQKVNSPREEIMSLNKSNWNPARIAFVDASKFAEDLSQLTFKKDTLAKVALLRNGLDTLQYAYTSAQPGFLVMSEVFYADKKGKGWQAYLDGNPVSHIRVNYVLRGMNVPAGNHKIEFRFEPKPFLRGQNYAMIGSYLILLIIALSGFMIWREYTLSKKNAK
ncbi:MAG: hypothetical protein RL138_628 [Bacteroidota bacterium]